jgi:maleylacetate reductase
LAVRRTTHPNRDLYTRRFTGGQVVILDPALTVHTPEWLWL